MSIKLYTTVREKNSVLSTERLDAMMTKAAAGGAVYIDGSNIAANSIYANSIVAEAITAEKLAADSVTAGKIKSGSITTGHITAGGLNANVITTGILRSKADTATTGSFINMDTGELSFAGGNMTWNPTTKDFYINARTLTIGGQNVLTNNTDIIQLINDNPGVARISGKKLHFTNEVVMDQTYIQKLTSDQMFLNYIEARDINADRIKTGTLSANRISGGTIDARNVTITNLNASNITTGNIDIGRGLNITNNGHKLITMDTSNNMTLNVASLKVNASPVATSQQIDDKINEISIGGTNLIQKRNFGEYRGGSVHSTEKIEEINYKYTAKESIYDLVGFSTEINAGEQYLTISCSSNTPIVTMYYKFNNSAQGNTVLTKTNSRFQKTINIPSGATSINIGIGRFPHPSPFTEYYIDKPQIEYGKIMTSWSPSPEDLDDTINNITFGGRNYIRGSRNMIVSSGAWNTGTFMAVAAEGTNETVDAPDLPVLGVDKALKLTKANNPSQNQYGIRQNNVHLDAGDWTLSYWIKGPIGTSVRLAVFHSNANPIEGTAEFFQLTSNEWKKYTLTATNTKPGNYNIGYAFVGTPEVDIYVAAPKLEKGKIATDWSEALEDSTSNINIARWNSISEGNTYIQSNEYMIRKYPITETPTNGDEYIITIKGELGQGKTSFAAYNSGGAVHLRTLTYLGNGIYQGSFSWKDKSSNYTADNRHVHIYTFPNTVTVNSTIEWITVVKGNIGTNEWIPSIREFSDKIENLADNINVGGRNYFRGYKHNEVINVSNYQNTGSFIQLTDKITYDLPSANGKKFVISFEAISPNGESDIQIYNRNGDPRYFNFESVVVGKLNTNWQKFYKVITPKTLDNYGASTNSNRLEIYAPSKMGVKVRNIKIEEGNVPSDWTPAPEDVEQMIDDVTIGGRNYFTKNSWTRETVKNAHFELRGTETPNGFKVTGNASSNGTVRIQNVVTENGWWTFSFDAKSNSNIEGSFTVDICDRVSKRFTIPGDGIYRRYFITSFVDIWSESTYNFVDFQNIKNTSMSINNIKIEKGNKATDWTPAPEDMFQSIGGRNYALKTSTPTTATTDTYNKNKAYFYSDELTIEKIKESQYISLSADIEIRNIKAITGQTYNRIGLELSINTPSGVKWLNVFYYPTRVGESYKGRIQSSLYVPNDIQSHKNNYIGAHIQIQADYASISNVKLELGDTPTDWSEAPEDISTKIEEAGKGNRNLLIGTKDMSGNLRNSEKGNYEEYVTAKVTSGTTGYVDAYETVTSIVPKETYYFLTFFAKANKQTTIQNFFYSPNTTIKSTNNQGGVITNTDGRSEINISTEWKKYWIKWEQNASNEKKRVIIGRTRDATVEIAAPALYEGEAIRDYAEAPEDLELKINQLKIGGDNYFDIENAGVHNPYNTELNIDGNTMTFKMATSSSNNVGRYITLRVNDFTPTAEEWVLSGFIKINNNIPSSIPFTNGSQRANTYAKDGKFYYDRTTGYFALSQEHHGSGNGASWLLHTALNANNNDVIQLRDIKFEKGNKATVWSEYYKKVENTLSAELNTTKEEISTFAGKIATIQDAINQKLSADTHAEFVKTFQESNQQLLTDLKNADEKIKGLVDRATVIENTLGSGAEEWIFNNTKIKLADEGILIGDKGSGSYVLVTSNQIAFYNGSQEPVATISGGMLNINHAVFVESIKIKDYQVTSEQTGHITFRYVGK